MDWNAAFNQFRRQLGRCFVITCHVLADRLEITRERTHPDAADADKKDVMDLVQIHLISFTISSTISFVANGFASFLIFRPSSARSGSSFSKLFSVLLNCVSSSASFNINAPPLSTMALAFLVWWSSATFGDGMKITGLPTKHNSD